MITRTIEGYSLNNWEGRTVKLQSGARITAGEIRAALCRKNGLNQKESATELNCGIPNVKQFWQGLYYKLNTSDVVVALDKLVEIGALLRLMPILLSVCLFATLTLDTDDNTQMARRVRSRRGRDYAALEEADDLPEWLEMDFIKRTTV